MTTEQTDLRCPMCGSVLQIVEDGMVGVPYATGLRYDPKPVVWKMENRPFAACVGCEFCVEIQPIGIAMPRNAGRAS